MTAARRGARAARSCAGSAPTPTKREQRRRASSASGRRQRHRRGRRGGDRVVAGPSILRHRRLGDAAGARTRFGWTSSKKARRRPCRRLQAIAVLVEAGRRGVAHAVAPRVREQVVEQPVDVHLPDPGAVVAERRDLVVELAVEGRRCARRRGAGVGGVVAELRDRADVGEVEDAGSRACPARTSPVGDVADRRPPPRAPTPRTPPLAGDVEDVVAAGPDRRPAAGRRAGPRRSTR